MGGFYVILSYYNHGENMAKLIAALGNPGAEYEHTRHNIAWQALARLPFYNELEWRNKFKGEYAVQSLNGDEMFFLKPLTYMNRSGESIQSLVRFFKLELADIIVLHDELELDFGVIGFKRNGGLGGHNGLRSIAAYLGSRDFNRMRLGISRPDHDDITSYVLGSFSPGERDFLPLVLEEAARLLEIYLQNGFDFVAERFKKKRVIP